MLTVADAERNPSGLTPARVPREAPMTDAGRNGTHDVPGGLNFRHDFGGRVIVRGHPQEAQPFSDLRDDVPL